MKNKHKYKQKGHKSEKEREEEKKRKRHGRLIVSWAYVVILAHGVRRTGVVKVGGG